MPDATPNKLSCVSRFRATVVFAALCGVLLFVGSSYNFTLSQGVASKSHHNSILSGHEFAKALNSIVDVPRTLEGGKSVDTAFISAAEPETQRKHEFASAVKPKPSVDVSKEPREKPVNAIFLAAAGIEARDLLRTLASIAESAADVLVVLVVTETDISTIIPVLSNQSSSYWSSQPAGSAPPHTITLNLLVYSWAALDALQPQNIQGRLAPMKRYSFYSWILEDLQR